MRGAERGFAECVVIGLVFVIIILSPGILLAQDAAKPNEGPTPAANETAELAKKFANPIASPISVTFQNNTFYGICHYNGLAGSADSYIS